MATMAEMMAYAMDQLRKEGVPEQNLQAAAAHLVGQASAESGLKPSAVHDGGTGYGIYGARLNRRNDMMDWQQQNGFPRDSAEGQMRYMAHEAMTRYPTTRDALVNATPDNLRQNVDRVTSDFESPAVVNNRWPKVAAAYNTTPAPPPQPNLTGISPDGAPDTRLNTAPARPIVPVDPSGGGGSQVAGAAPGTAPQTPTYGNSGLLGLLLNSAQTGEAPSLSQLGGATGQVGSLINGDTPNLGSIFGSISGANTGGNASQGFVPTMNDKPDPNQAQPQTQTAPMGIPKKPVDVSALMASLKAQPMLGVL